MCRPQGPAVFQLRCSDIAAVPPVAAAAGVAALLQLQQSERDLGGHGRCCVCCSCMLEVTATRNELEMALELIRPRGPQQQRCAAAASLVRALLTLKPLLVL